MPSIKTTRSIKAGRAKQALWFVGLWLAGVLSMTLVASLIRLAMRLEM